MIGRSSRSGGVSTLDSPDRLSSVVDTLRAAGCVFAEEEAALIAEAAESRGQLDEMVARRVTGLPLEQVVGWAEFCGLRIHVESGVFVPRRRTEVLAREAIARAGGAGPSPVVVDLCCGTGAVGAVLALAVPGVELYASDIEEVAVRCARRNIGRQGEVLHGDLDEPLPAGLAGRVDVLVANVPYVPSAEIGLLPAEARLYEPRVSLDGGDDGLRVLARVAAVASRWLAPGGSVLCETSEPQAATARAIFETQALRTRLLVDKELGATVVIGTRER